MWVMVLVHLPDGTTATVSAGTVEEILAGLGLNPYEILATCGGELLLGDDFVSDDQVLATTSIVHGG
jgi:sulfur carrier protein ThiS